ncbi:DUF1214 domain-containing protein [Sorangium sp. So ce1128]
MRFEEGGLPPAKAFWSLSMYDQSTMGFVPNPIGRYSLGSDSDLAQAEDGSVTGGAPSVGRVASRTARRLATDSQTSGHGQPDVWPRTARRLATDSQTSGHGQVPRLGLDVSEEFGFPSLPQRERAPCLTPAGEP